MVKITVDKPTVFFCSEKPLMIFDEFGILFYSDSFVKNFKGFFNVPRGTFYTKNTLTKKAIVLNDHNKIKLPPMERNFNHKWDEFKISFEPNPHKCTINHKNKTIVFDTSFKTQPLYIKAFILFHEMGHNYYHSEEKADLYAIKKMIKEGFNISQIGMAPLNALSEKSNFRKKYVIDNLNYFIT